ncbi:MAG: ribosomal-processing cysteine protease Prp [Erysipelotrichaceae bacterium]|nr:ribosomal-processing cysteine protease Prp [Erysipelotrichaceae bacterium]
MVHVVADIHDGYYTAVTVSGHAESADYGQDLVCAGVSSIAFGLCNALSDLAGLETIQAANNMISIRCEEQNDLVQVILETGIIQFRTVAMSYADYIDIQITEV